jgi:hypothetical protein
MGGVWNVYRVSEELSVERKKNYRAIIDGAHYSYACVHEQGTPLWCGQELPCVYIPFRENFRENSSPEVT